MYSLSFESSERAEDFRHYLQKHTDISLRQAQDKSDAEQSCYEFVSYGYSGFVMQLVYEICFAGGIDYDEMGNLPLEKREKYVESHLFAHAIWETKAWRPPFKSSREFRWVSDNLRLTERQIEKILQRAKRRYHNWLAMEKRYSLLIGVIFLLLGFLFSILSGPTSWPALLFYSFAVMLLIFFGAKTMQTRKKKRSRLPG